MGHSGMVFSAVAPAIGAIMCWAVTYQIRDSSFDRGTCPLGCRKIWFRCFGDYLCRLTGFREFEQSRDEPSSHRLCGKFEFGP